MGTDNTRIVYETQLEVPVNVDDELVNEVEVVTVDDSEPGASDEIPQPAANAPEEGATSTSSVAISSPWDYQTQLDLLDRKVTALKERLADLIRRQQEGIIEEELPAQALEIITTPPVATRNSLPSPSNPAVKSKSSISKYAKKRRTVMLGGITRISRSFNEKPTTTTVGNVNLATAAYADDDEFD